MGRKRLWRIRATIFRYIQRDLFIGQYFPSLQLYSDIIARDRSPVLVRSLDMHCISTLLQVLKVPDQYRRDNGWDINLLDETYFALFNRTGFAKLDDFLANVESLLDESDQAEFNSHFRVRPRIY